MPCSMADDPGPGPFALPERWVHADKPPSWTDLGTSTVAFVRWRLDRWPSLERLHALDRIVRAHEDDGLVVGLHAGRGEASLERVRDVLLARGTWAPTGIVEAEPTWPGAAQPGAIALVAGGEIVETFGPGDPIGDVGSRIAEQAGASEPGWQPRGDAPGPWPLAFPSDVAIGGSRLGVADTGHNRVLVARPGGDILHLVGDGVPDHRDGSLDQARFEAPRGVCWRGEELLVADTGNDAIRAVDPGRGEVGTLLQAPEGSLPAGLAHDGDELFVALAGEGSLARLEDGELVRLQAIEEGHPVDVALQRGSTVWADLTGARVHRLTPEASSSTLWEGAPLVEPSGLLAEDTVLVADPGSGTVHELAMDGTGEPGQVLGAQAGLQSPAALDREAERIVVADGGGHHLWRLDPEDTEPPSRIRLTESPLSLAEHIRLDPIEMAPGARLELSISYMLTNDQGPEEVQAPTARGPMEDLTSREGPVREEGRIRTELTGRVAASGNLRIRWSLTPEDVGHEAAWDLPIVVRPGAEDRLRLALSTSPP